ncbi:hypothetical protein JCM11641_004506 [Rhodosporidiobolus odoratus]
MPFRMPPPSQQSASLSPASPTSPPTMSNGTLRLPAPPPPPKPLHLTMKSVRGLAAAFENGTVRGRGDGDEAEGEQGNEMDRSTKSKRGLRPGMPRWSVAVDAQEDVGEDEQDGGGTIKPGAAPKLGNDEGEEQERREAHAAVSALAALFPDVGTLSPQPDKTPPAVTKEQVRESSESTTTASEGGSGIYCTPIGTLRLPPGSVLDERFDKRASTIKVRGKDGRLSIYFDAKQPNPFLAPSTPPASVRPASPASPSSSPDTPAATSPAPPDLPDKELLLPLPTTASPAVTLHSFTGEPSFGELSFSGGVALRIEVEDLGGGWSLGFIESEGEEARGLVPRGWYAYVDLPKSATHLPSPSTSPTPASPDSPPPAHNALATVSPLEVETPAEETRVLEPAPLDEPGYAQVAGVPHIGFRASLAKSVREDPPLSSTPETTPAAVQDSIGSPPTTTSPSLAPPAMPVHEDSASYPIRSIGRHVVVSGIEFEPIPGTPTEEMDEKDVELSVDELLRREEQATSRANAEGAMNAREAEGGRAKAEGTAADDLLNPATPPHAGEHEAPSSPLKAPPADVGHTVPPRPAPVSSSLLFRLGLSSTPSSSFSLSLPLPLPGRSTIPGASVLAATHEITPKKRRLPRLEDEAKPEGRGKEVVMQWVEEGDEEDDRVEELESETGKSGGLQVWENEASSFSPFPRSGVCSKLLTLSVCQAGPAWRPLSEPFLVHIHSPCKQSPMNASPFTTYTLTTVFSPSPSSSSSNSPSLSVTRRFSHFTALHSLLSARFLSPLIYLPPLSPKAFGNGRFSETFVEQRRRDLERWLGKVGRHPVLGESEELRGFLAIEGEKELLIHLHAVPLSPPPAPVPLFPARVFHPSFNVDLDEAEELGEKFERYCRAVELGGGWREVEQRIARGREGQRVAATNLQSFAHSLVRLAAGLALPPLSCDAQLSPDSSGDTTWRSGTELQNQQHRARAWAVQSSQGGMTWREEDEGSLSLAKALQATAESLANVGDLQDETARSALLGPQEVLHDGSNPLLQYSPLIDLHRTIVTTYRRLSRMTSSDAAAHDALARCETMLNITCAEMHRVMDERNEEMKSAVEDWLAAVIAEKEQTLDHLRYALDHFSPTSFPSLAVTGPRLRSSLKACSTPRTYPPLSQPTASVVSGGLGWAGAAVGSVFSSGAGGRFALGQVGVRRTQTTGASRGYGRYDAPSEAEEDTGDAGTGEERAGTWRESIFGTMRKWG